MNPNEPKCICGEINARHCPVHNKPKPREWFIGWPDGENLEEVHDANSGGVHVIEYSAFDRMRRDRDEWEAKYKASEWVRKDSALRTYDGLVQERDQLKRELERQEREGHKDCVRIENLERELAAMDKCAQEWQAKHAEVFEQLEAARAEIERVQAGKMRRRRAKE